MSATILQLGAGPLMLHPIRLLKQMGFRVFVMDRNPASPGFACSDGYAALNIIDSEIVARYARQIRADLIVAVNEAGVLSAAKASRQLGLPGITPETALRCLDKGLMRTAWHRENLPQPRFRIAQAAADIPALAAEIGYPVVLKPAMNWGSRGVSLASNAESLPWAIEFATAHTRGHAYVVEECVDGVEMTIEGLVQHGRPQILAKSDKEAQKHPRYRVAMALNYPARFSPAQLHAADEVVARAALALGIENGAFHCECMINEHGVHLIEMGARGGGGHIFGQIVEAVSGVCMPQALVKILLGMDVDIRPRYQHGACYKFFAPPAGIFREAQGIDQAKKMTGILDFGFSLLPGTLVEAIGGDADRPGFVVAAGSNREQAIARADQAIAAIRYIMEPALGLERKETPPEGDK